MTKDDDPDAYRDALLARARALPLVVGFLFAHPDSDAYRQLEARHAYFDLRTGDRWDLFFPGYYTGIGPGLPTYGDRRVQRDRRGREWLFNPAGFDLLRRHIERSSRGRWTYSGNTDLVLIGASLPTARSVYAASPPVIDWQSCIGGEATDQGSGARTLTLGAIIERVSRDLESGTEDQHYGVGALFQEVPTPPSPNVSTEIAKGALSGIVAGIFKSVTGV